MTDQSDFPELPEETYPPPTDEVSDPDAGSGLAALEGSAAGWSVRVVGAPDQSPVFIEESEDSPYFRGAPPEPRYAAQTEYENTTSISDRNDAPILPVNPTHPSSTSISTGAAGDAAPLQGCLYCHSPGTTKLTESKPVLGIVGGGPLITCSACGAVASFEPGTGSDGWRIKYRSFNRSSRFYYVMVYLGLAGWLSAQEALDFSRRGFIQRHRLQQTQYGDLGWLAPHKVAPPPPLMSPSETLYMRFNPASLSRNPGGGRLAAVLTRGEGLLQDTGTMFVTDMKIHLLGQARDWSHKLTEVSRVEYNERYWRLHVAETGQYYQGNNAAGQIDAQLFTVVIQHLTPH